MQPFIGVCRTPGDILQLVWNEWELGKLLQDSVVVTPAHIKSP